MVTDAEKRQLVRKLLSPGLTLKLTREEALRYIEVAKKTRLPDGSQVGTILTVDNRCFPGNVFSATCVRDDQVTFTYYREAVEWADVREMHFIVGVNGILKEVEFVPAG